MFKENELIVKEIYSVLNDELEPEIAQKLYSTLEDFNNNEIHDAGIMIEIINKLISYYEKQKD